MPSKARWRCASCLRFPLVDSSAFSYALATHALVHVRSWLIGLVCLAFGWLSLAAAPRPNVVLVMMDDLGYGDLGCHGSPFIQTPHLDALHATGVRLADFHVAPMCSPTRGQLLTGRDALRNGASIIASSRLMVRADVPMMPAMFAFAGYATALFGKWHLGENHPHRPQDRGFQETLWFPMQEISSLADHWGNDYFDPVLRRRDGRTEKFAGYCTDIFFREALTWMRRQHEAGKPFLCYLPLNVVHGPQWAPRELRETLARQFPKLSPGQVGYLAMLANADQNFGRLETFLTDTGLRENTVVVFLSDNGGYALIGHYNAGMRDGKSRLAEGGHRVPCFIRWPAGGIGGGRDLPGLTQVQDLLPTLLELCGVEPAASANFDGASLAKPLRGESPVPDRTLIVQYGLPEPFRMTCVMRGRWRLLIDIKGTAQGQPELYNLADDPLQRTNLIAAQPERAKELRAAYDAWWHTTGPLTRQRAFISLGHPDGSAAVLNSTEWREGAMHGMAGLRQGVKRRGMWDVEVARDGTYEFSLRRWPEESGLALRAAAPPWTPRDTATPDHAGFPAGAALPIVGAQLRVGEQRTNATVGETDRAAVFRLPLKAGRTEVEATFQDADGRHLCSAFFVTGRRVD
jgi:arylsulfatase